MCVCARLYRLLLSIYTIYSMECVCVYMQYAHLTVCQKVYFMPHYIVDMHRWKANCFQHSNPMWHSKTDFNASPLSVFFCKNRTNLNRPWYKEKFISWCRHRNYLTLFFFKIEWCKVVELEREHMQLHLHHETQANWSARVEQREKAWDEVVRASMCVSWRKRKGGKKNGQEKCIWHLKMSVFN